MTKLRSGASLRLYTVDRVRAWIRVNKRALMAQSRGRGAELQAESPDDPENRVQRRIAFPRERLAEMFPGQAGIVRDLRHAPGAGDVAQRLGDERSVAVGLCHARVQIRGGFLRGAKVVRDIVG